ncbi:MAG: hypothetical protein NC218_03340 [Acetobacter sp.]|nr:hypothetical protein [Acetobacter sp.]
MTKPKYRKYFEEYMEYLNKENKGGDLDLTLLRTLQQPTTTSIKKSTTHISGLYRFKDGKFMRVFYDKSATLQEVLLSLCNKDNRVLAMMTLNNEENNND